MQTNIGLTTETRDKLAQILNTVLADEHVLYTKLRNYHWNVTGWDFISLHALLDEQYDQVKVLADDVAERVRMIGFHPIGTLKAFLDATRLDEAPGSELDARAMVRDLLETNEAMVRNLRADVEETLETFGDEGTGDLLIEAMRMHEEMAWMLRSLLE
ncbi:MAG: DNA starvation/stationary phase protection protein [Anaerolineales bacterium]|nr:DNA starvation/stationary phase protection protein [Anaerolineales bacterium]